MLHNLLGTQLLFDGDGAAGGKTDDGTSKGTEDDKGKQQDDKGKQQEKDQPSYKDWFTKQPEEVQTLITENESGLKSALTSEREARGDLEDKVRDLAKDAEKDSDLQKQLTTIADELKTVSDKADFYEVAHEAGVTNLKLAWLLVQSDEDLLDRKGNANFDTMKKSNPELFAKVAPKPKGNQGEGTGSESPTSEDMNVRIRKAARGG